MRPLALFDLDNTLIDRAESFARWSTDFAVQRGLPSAATAWLVEADGDGFVPRPQFFTRVRERYGLREAADHMWADYRATYPGYARIRPEVLDALGRLREARFRLGIVTNGTAQTQRAKIDRTGLAAWVDAVCVSEEVGVRKPDQVIFAVAAHRCGATLSGGGWMIGDSPALDVAGGAGAGLATVWIRRGRSWTGDGPAPDHVADDVVEAMDWLHATVPV